MALQPDDRSPDAPAARPRGWLRATIVAPLAIAFVGAGDRLRRIPVAAARRRR